MRNTKNSSDANNIDLKFFKLRKCVDNGDANYEHSTTKNMLADPLTKGLRPINSNRHIEHIGILIFFFLMHIMRVIDIWLYLILQ